MIRNVGMNNLSFGRMESFTDANTGKEISINTKKVLMAEYDEAKKGTVISFDTHNKSTPYAVVKEDPRMVGIRVNHTV